MSILSTARTHNLFEDPADNFPYNPVAYEPSEASYDPEERGSESSYDPEELGSELSYVPEEWGSEASYDPDEQVDPVSVENVDAVSELCLLFQELRL
jgi:hypothetical protein